MQFHSIANTFPMMSETDLVSLADDIKANGLHDDIILLGEQILDGRNRYCACEMAGVAPRYRQFGSDAHDGYDPLTFVISHNLRRRHLNETQRGLVAAKLSNLKLGQKLPHNSETSIDVSGQPLISLDDAAKMLHVGSATVGRARRILKHGVEGLVNMAERGEVSANAACRVTSLPAEEQQALVEQGPKAVKQKARVMRGDSTRTRKKPAARKSMGKRRIAVTDDKVLDVVETLQHDIETWESLHGLIQLVSTWERKQRWTFCERLEALAGRFRKLALKLRDLPGQT